MIKELSRALNSKPTYLFFTVTSRCNAFCDFCWNWKNVLSAGKFYRPNKPVLRNELSLEEIEKITLSLPAMLTVNLFGGEPFIRKDLVEIISLFVKNSKTLYLSIPTNGTLTEKILSDVKASLVAHQETFFKIYLSLDGPPEVHNKLRKIRDGYQNLVKTLDGLVELRKQYVNLSISCNANFNFDTQDTMADFLEEVCSWQKFDSISVDLVRGELRDNALHATKLDLYRELQGKLKKYKLNSNQPFSPLHKAVEQKTAEVVQESILYPDKRAFDCFAGKKLILLDDIGNVISCEMMMDNIIGNLRDFDYDIAKLLKSEKALQIRKDIVDKKCNCRWECAINNSNICDVKNYPDLIFKSAKNVFHSLARG